MSVYLYILILYIFIY